MRLLTALLCLALGPLVAACNDKVSGDTGPIGSDGSDGTDGTDGSDGSDGTDGTDGGETDDDGDGHDASVDCDDTNEDVHPDAVEVCDGVDNDCDEQVDDADDDLDSSTGGSFYVDADADGYGNPESLVQACLAPVGTVEDGTDCNDTDIAVNPAAIERCDEEDLDEDCDGLADDEDDEVDATTQVLVYIDDDNDGHGDASDEGTLYCDPPGGFVAEATDCDDSNAAVSPDGIEVCDEADTDEDCNELADDADPGVDLSTGTTWYPDLDNDGYGDALASGTLYCDAATGRAGESTDCDDGDSTVNPAATDLPQDGTDQDCDGEDAPYTVTDLVPGDLIITEVMQNPSAVLDSVGEWFELHNNSGGEIDLAGLYVYDLNASGAVGSSFTVSGALRVGDGEYVVLGLSTDTSVNGGAPVDYAYSSSTALGNSDDELYLSESSARAVVIDAIEWDDGDTFPDPNGASMSLCPDSFDADDNDDGANWIEATSTFGSGDQGTPGAANDSCD